MNSRRVWSVRAGSEIESTAFVYGRDDDERPRARDESFLFAGLAPRRRSRSVASTTHVSATSRRARATSLVSHWWRRLSARRVRTRCVSLSDASRRRRQTPTTSTARARSRATFVVVVRTRRAFFLSASDARDGWTRASSRRARERHGFMGVDQSRGGVDVARGETRETRCGDVRGRASRVIVRVARARGVRRRRTRARCWVVG